MSPIQSCSGEDEEEDEEEEDEEGATFEVINTFQFIFQASCFDCTASQLYLTTFRRVSLSFWLSVNCPTSLRSDYLMMAKSCTRMLLRLKTEIFGLSKF